MRTITLEEHFLTKDYLDATDAFRGMAAALQPLLDVGEGRIAAMRESGIDLQVLSLAALGMSGIADDDAVPLLHDTNDELAAAVAAHPESFAGFAAVPLQRPAEAAKELERCINELGFVGVMCHGTEHGLFLDDPRFTPFWEAASALGVPVYLHPAEPPAPVMDAYFRGLPGDTGFLLSIAGWGWHSETALHGLRLIASGLLDRMPDLQIILGHMGEMLPFALARSSGVLSRSSHTLQRTAEETFRQQFHITTSGYFTRPPFDCAEAVVGIDRIMFSVDYPFSPNTKGRAFLDSLNPMNNDRRAKLVHGNAERLLKLPPQGTHA